MSTPTTEPRGVGAPPGELHSLSVLTDADVIALRLDRAQDGTSWARLAKRYGCSTMTAYNAGTGRTWRHLDHLASPVK